MQGKFVKYSNFSPDTESGFLVEITCPVCGQTKYWENYELQFHGLKHVLDGVAICACGARLTFSCDADGNIEELSAVSAPSPEPDIWEISFQVTGRSDACLHRQEISGDPNDWFLCTHPYQEHPGPCEEKNCLLKKEETP